MKSTTTKHRKASGRAKAKKIAVRDVAKVTKEKSSRRVTSGAGFPVVGIGASAGGLEALSDLFKNMPPDTGIAFVVITHQHPGHTSLLPEILGKCTGIPVVEAKDGIRLEPNRVYVGPPGGYVAIMDSTLQFMDGPREEMPPLAIDFFFRSLAIDQKERAVCIVLSGTGTDGTIGLKAVKGELGIAMVQDVASARYAGMPASAIATSLADYVLAPSAMPAQLVTFAKGVRTYRTHVPEANEMPPEMEPSVQKILVLLRSRVGHDFSSYKMNTVHRRIERRMNVLQIARPEKYIRYLQENPHELTVLFKELLISVTNFFRDPESFVALSEKALTGLVDSRPDNHTLRVWVPGCATGEEPYSIAILLRECMEKLNKNLAVQIFGTDLDVEAIEFARAGHYPAGISVDVSAERLARYFSLEDGTYKIRKEIREMVIFAQQNVIKDPPFTKLDLLSSRNLLIYLNADLQRRILPIFHYSLAPSGILVLGPSETIGAFTDLFEAVDKKWKIYRCKETAGGRKLPEMPAQRTQRVQRVEAGESVRHDPEEHGFGPSAPSVKEARISTVLEKLLLARFAPAGVVVNERGEIIYIHGRTGMFLEPGTGTPRLNVLDMAREGLHQDLSSALREAVAHDRDVVRERIRVASNDGFTIVNVSVSPIRDPQTAAGLFVVTFQAAAQKQAHPSRKKGGAAKESELERQLRYTKESLQTTVEELETSNEELQSTNEELQSTNEELETSKEELQSLNEELTIVNTELQAKVEELSRTNDDMQNLLNSTDIATLFLDNDLKIKRYTEQAKKLVKLIPTDIGRPLSDLVSEMEYDRMEQDARDVLRTLVFKEIEIRTRDNAWYQVRLMPYRTADNVIDGLVITFVNIDRIKRLEKAGKEARAMYENLFSILRQPILVLDERLSVTLCNASYYAMFNTQPGAVEGTSVLEIPGPQWKSPDMRDRLLRALAGGEFGPGDTRVGYENRFFTVNARRINIEGAPVRILLVLEEEKTAPP